MNLQTKDITLKRMTDIMRYIRDNGYECWIEGLGNGEIKIVIKDKFINF